MSRPIAPIEERRLLGIGFVLIGMLCMTIIDSCAKWLAAHGMPVGQVVFVRYAGQFVLVLAILWPMHGRALLHTRSWKLEAARSLALLGSTVFNFLAVTFLPLTITSAISFTMPLIICALSIPMLGEQVGWRRWLAILVGFVGVLIIVRPGTDSFSPALIFSFLAVTCAALYNLLNRRLAGIDSTATQQFYGAGLATLCIAPFGLSDWHWPSAPADWFAFLLIGAMAFIGHLFITVAHRYAPASTLAPFTYVQIIYMTSASWLVFNQPPDIFLFLGAPIVIGSGLFIWLRERQLGKSATPVTVQD